MEGVVMNSNFWKDKKVFLTGHTGFKGSWLSLWLQQAGAKVTGYALPPPTGFLKEWILSLVTSETALNWHQVCV